MLEQIGDSGWIEAYAYWRLGPEYLIRHRY